MRILELLIVITFIIEIESILLHDGWFGIIKSSGETFQATVPGGIFTDLENARLIQENLRGFNDVRNRKIANETITYVTHFEINDTFLQAPKVALVFYGLDTFSNIFLNDDYIGTTENMFLKYAFDVKKKLKAGINKLEVLFASPLRISQNLYSDQKKSYEVLPSCTPKEYKGECHVNHIRKMQASFGWDWGPAFPSMGIWKNVELLPLGETYVTDVSADVIKKKSYWEVILEIFLDTLSYQKNVPLKMNVKVQLNLDNGKILSNTVNDVLINIPEKYGNTSIVLRVPEESVQLWWPNGYGEQKLYKIITWINFSNREFVVEKELGFRTIELVQDPVDEGLTFYFRVNGLPIFAKGSNYIPGSIFPELSTKQEIFLPLLTSAKEANMNMLRVWGGGLYESDEFYNLADKLGILIWQDFMFACNMYPSTNWFLKTVKAEVIQNVRRLKHHPSIALWAGNNENEIALYGNWYGTGDKQVYRDDYLKLYVNLIKNQVEKLDTTRPYIVSSPSDGLYSEKNGYLGTNPTSNLYGDVHYYNYFENGWDINHYPRARFSSEYGFQSWPSIETLITAAESEEDLRIGSAFLLHRQHLPLGDTYMKLLIGKNFKIPESNTTRRDLEDFIYLSQINQAVSVKIETESYRQGKSSLNSIGEGFTRGALYWQLNDVWQAPSWSSIEFGGRWKMLHYYARDFFAPVIVTSSLSEARELTIYIVSDLYHTLRNLSVDLKIYKWNSMVPLSVQKLINIAVGVDESKPVKKFWLDQHLRSAGCGSLALASKNCLLELVLINDTDNQVMSINYVYGAPPKSVDLPVAKITINVNPKPLPGKFANYLDYEIELVSDNLALFVWLETGLIQGRFSENGFHMLEQSKKIILHAFESISPKEIQKNVYVKTLSDVYVSKRSQETKVRLSFENS